MALLVGFPFLLSAQDTTFVQTFTYDSTGRAAVFQFPDDPDQRYEKIYLEYSMRCHDLQVGNGSVGCREWDYHCNTVLTDSSRVDSSRSFAPSHVITDFSGTSFPLSFDTTYDYFQFELYEVDYQSVISEQTASVGMGVLDEEYPFRSDLPQVKSQYLWTAAELAGAGLTAGEITSLRLDLGASAAVDLNFLTIQIKHTNKTFLDSNDPDTDGFTRVYRSHRLVSGSGSHDFNFYEPFTWDGVSNVLVEFSFRNPGGTTALTVASENSGGAMGMVNGRQESHLEFSGHGSVEVPGGALISVSNEVTVSFWAYGGGADLPANTSAFEGLGAGGRQANAHLPWGNGSVFWDCGNDGTGYDRISYAADPADYKGRWTHWAFTKNASTGEMAIYVDGQMVHSGTGYTRPIQIEEFIIGSQVSGGSGFRGEMDDFRVWNVALDGATIQDWMYRDVDATHPNYANLQLNYLFDEGSGTQVADVSPHGQDGTVGVGPVWRQLWAMDFRRNYEVVQERPNAVFVQGSYTQTVDTVVVLDSVVAIPHGVESFAVVGTDLTSLGTEFYFHAAHQYIYDEQGEKVDSILVPTDSTIQVVDLEHYVKEPARYEILSFITPYGNGLDLGAEGVRWTIDVSDYAPILKGSKRLSIEGRGKNQEEMDLRFVFVEGVPPRDVIDVQQIWPIRSASAVWFGFGFPEILNDDFFEPRDVVLDPTASHFKLRSAVTGHSQNGEFIPRWHSLNLDGGVEEFRYQVWKECSELPVYPQGGTWLYDRAGWCPGMPTDVYEFGLDAYVNPGQTVSVDYHIDAVSNTANSDYRVANQLVTYGPVNHQLDAAVERVIRPSQAIEYARFNPACTEPVVVIANKGATTLTSLVITYQVRGGSSRTYEWTGNLGFLETEEVTLPVDNPAFWQTNGGEQVFEVRVSAPNGEMDAYALNDVYFSSFESWDSYSGALSLRWRTNNKPSENVWRIYDETGAVVLQSSPFISANTIYEEDLALPMGCYTLRMEDSGDDGLYYWALSSQGSGFAHFEENGVVDKVFESEFGGFFQYDFWTDGAVGAREQVEHPQYIRLYPNPAQGDFSLEMQGWKNAEIQVEVFDGWGNLVTGRRFKAGTGMVKEDFRLQEVAAGTYWVKIYDGQRIYAKQLVIQ